MKQLSTLLLTTGFITISSHLTFAQTDQNTVLGYQAGNNTTMTGQGNTYLGFQSGVNTTSGNNNVFIGNQVGYTNTAGYSNVFIGNRAGYSNTNSVGNLFLGSQAGYSNSSGSYNLFMGNSSGQATTTGTGNVAIGDGSLLNNSTGLNITSIGRYSGIYQTTGQNNTFIGTAASSGAGSGAISNATAIGYYALVTASNSLILGNGVNVGIGNTAPTNKLHVTTGTANTSGLRLENLTSSSPASVLSQTKFLTVDGSGNVVLGSTGSTARLGAEFWSASGDNLHSTNSGGVVIGSGVNQTPIGYKLYVEQGILTEKVKVAVKSSADWSDYVFAPGYKLASLADVALHIQQKGHLPGIPSAKEMVEKGNDLHQTDAKLLEKIEELTLYLIEQRKELAFLQTQNSKLGDQNHRLLNRVTRLERKVNRRGN